ncbi:MAG: lysophospholipid acyltransferase family protein [Candidatus Delongbacteria bacterium]
MRASYRFVAWVLRQVFRLGYRLEVSGLERIPRQGSLILASNHQSNLDPPLIGCFFPREISFVAKKQLFENPWLARLMRHFNALPLDRSGVDLRALREIRARLGQGHDLLVFPEGTRSRDGRLGQPRAGLGLIISAAEVDVLPVLILGSRSSPGLPGFRPVIRLEFGAPIPRAALPLAGDPGELEGRGRSSRAEALTRVVFQRIEAMYASANPPDKPNP